MSWIDDNKGQGVWGFEKSPQKIFCNEGDSISSRKNTQWQIREFSGEPVTDGHKPCGYWNSYTGGKSDCIICQEGLTIVQLLDDGSVTDVQNTMNLNDQEFRQTLTVRPINSGCVFVWEVVEGDSTIFPGIGTTVEFLATIDTEKDGCTTSNLIKVYVQDCDEDFAVYQSINVLATICSNIFYTTNAMAINESQSLYVENPIYDNYSYNWNLSGGGSIEVAEGGLSAVYTAPESNVNCDNNAEIQLLVNGKVCDTLKIAINASTAKGLIIFAAGTPWYSDPMTGTNPSPNTGLCSQYYMLINMYLTGAWYNCDGSLYYQCSRLAVQLSWSTKYDQYGNLLSTKNADGYYYLCADEDYNALIDMAGKIKISGCYLGGTLGNNGLSWLAENSPIDNRLEVQKLAGCCPPQLL